MVMNFKIYEQNKFYALTRKLGLKETTPGQAW